MNYGRVQIQCYPSTKRSLSWIVERTTALRHGHSSAAEFRSELDASSRSRGPGDPGGPGDPDLFRRSNTNTPRNPRIVPYFFQASIYARFSLLVLRLFPPRNPGSWPTHGPHHDHVLKEHRKCSILFGIGFALAGRILSRFLLFRTFWNLRISKCPAWKTFYKIW